jgi:nucleotide-binding universal stress UspA family protein
MAMDRSVLVPLDGSEFSEHALPLAVDIVRKAGGTLHLCHVQAPVATVYSETPLFLQDNLAQQMSATERKRLQAYLEGVAGRIRNTVPGIVVTTNLQEGEPAVTLQKHADVAGIDLVLMTSHARGAVGRFWLGSVADELLRHLPVPILVVRPAANLPQVGAEVLPKVIVVPLDGTPLAEQMVRTAADVAKVCDAGLTLLRVIKPVVAMTPPVGGASMGQMAAELIDRLTAVQKELRKEALTYLERVAAPFRAEGLRVTTRVTQDEQPAVAILSEAELEGAGLIALATHGRRGLSRLVLGSVADKVVRAAKMPVLLCRPRV